MKSHNPTLHAQGYAFRRPLSKGMLGYLNEEERESYIHGHRTPEPELETPPRIGAQLGESVIFFRGGIEGVQEGAAKEEAQVRRERKRKEGRVARKEKKK